MQTMAGRHRGGQAGGGVAEGVDPTVGEVGLARGSPTLQSRKKDPRRMTIPTGWDRLSSDLERAIMTESESHLVTMAGTTAEQILIMNDETRTMTDLIPTPGDMTRTTDPLPLPILTTAALLHPQIPLTGGPTQSRTVDPMITAEIIMMRIDPHPQSRIDLSRNQRSLIMLTSHQGISCLERQKPLMWPHRLS